LTGREEGWEEWDKKSICILSPSHGKGGRKGGKGFRGCPVKGEPLERRWEREGSNTTRPHINLTKGGGRKEGGVEEGRKKKPM